MNATRSMDGGRRDRLKKLKVSTREFEKASAEHPSDQDKYILRLYITGATPKSLRAIANLKAVCEEYLKGRYELQVIDIYQQPQLARGEQIIAAPTLIKNLPTPLRRLVGDLSSREKVLLGLDLKPMH